MRKKLPWGRAKGRISTLGATLRRLSCTTVSGLGIHMQGRKRDGYSHGWFCGALWEASCKVLWTFMGVICRMCPLQHPAWFWSDRPQATVVNCSEGAEMVAVHVCRMGSSSLSSEVLCRCESEFLGTNTPRMGGPSAPNPTSQIYLKLLQKQVKWQFKKAVVCDVQG